MHLFNHKIYTVNNIKYLIITNNSISVKHAITKFKNIDKIIDTCKNYCKIFDKNGQEVLFSITDLLLLNSVIFEIYPDINNFDISFENFTAKLLKGNEKIIAINPPKTIIVNKGFILTKNSLITDKYNLSEYDYEKLKKEYRKKFIIVYKIIDKDTIKFKENNYYINDVITAIYYNFIQEKTNEEITLICDNDFYNVKHDNIIYLK